MARGRGSPAPDTWLVCAAERVWGLQEGGPRVPVKGSCLRGPPHLTPRPCLSKFTLQLSLLEPAEEWRQEERTPGERS